MISSRMLPAFVLLLALQADGAPSDKRPTGQATGNLYRDNAAGFTLEKYDNWKFGKINTEEPTKPRVLRCVLTQKTVAYPADYVGNEDKFTTPMISVFTDTSAMLLEAYAALLADHKSPRPARKEIARDFDILAKPTFVKREAATLDGQPAIVLHYRQNYEVQLYNRLRNQDQLKEDAILGDLYVTKRDGLMHMFALTCEREIYRTVNEEAKGIILSVDFDPPVDSSAATGADAPGR